MTWKVEMHEELSSISTEAESHSTVLGSHFNARLDCICKARQHLQYRGTSEVESTTEAFSLMESCKRWGKKPETLKPILFPVILDGQSVYFAANSWSCKGKPLFMSVASTPQ